MLLKVALDVPLPGLFDYRWQGSALIGQRVIVPWGKQTLIGLIIEVGTHTTFDPQRIKDAFAVLDDIEPLSDGWLSLMRFAADYYQRPIGEIALPALPALLRRAAAYQITEQQATARALQLLYKRLERYQARSPTQSPAQTTNPISASVAPILNDQQIAVLASLGALQGFVPWLLHGITGSGKTEIYLHAVATILQRGGQVLLLVPEINLTPQLEQIVQARFPQAGIASLHSGVADGARALQWLLAHHGHADIVLGTRMAVLASLPRLGLIIVDEEHDPSFKQQEGLRYSARDLAVVHAQQRDIPIILGSATPSLESWRQAQRGRYRKLTLTVRASQAELPSLQLVSLARTAIEHGFSATLKTAITQHHAAGEQVLIFLNRRGYAPVLHCAICAWISDCRRCSAHAVFHKNDRRLHCHHCGWSIPVPRACPECGNTDLAPLGRGTQRVEETLAHWFPSARIARIDRDSTRRKGSAENLFAAVHAGETDILVGTQMVAKGHDFRNLKLVGVLDADSALFSQDFRAAERLFANLIQVAGRAGRAGNQSGSTAQVLIQTRFPEHPLFKALVAHDYQRFANAELQERERAHLPPFSYQAIVRAEARTLTAALAFLQQARSTGLELASLEIAFYDPVPMNLVRLANIERAQLLIESSSRSALQGFLTPWLHALRTLNTRVRWHVEVDPLDI